MASCGLQCRPKRKSSTGTAWKKRTDSMSTVSTMAAVMRMEKHADRANRPLRTLLQKYEVEFFISPLLWRGGFDCPRKASVFLKVHRPMPDNGRCGIAPEIIVILQIVLWPHRPWRKTSAAIGANIFQYLLYASPAEGTFIGAYHCFCRGRRQPRIAMFE